ncbi:transcription termination factor MTERF9, chloroplastic-like [Aristolochia californica]|uniref:transcription termination factor MTERF9, chloroplastic-like n=1 Tax=Aristolochia californica TaxID=171875 RepID=UPI0035D762A9
MSHFFVRSLLGFYVLQYQSLRFLKTSPSKSPPSETVQFLMNTCGLSLKTAVAVSEKFTPELENRKTDVSASKKLQLEQKKLRKLHSVLALLKSHGFSEAHVEDFITRVPAAFRIKIDSNLQPKIQSFLDMGFSSSDIASLFVLNPTILERSLDNYLKPTFSVLKKLLHTNDHIMKALKRSRWLLSGDIKKTIIPNVAILVDEGVPSPALSKMIVCYPRVMTQKQEKFAEFVQWAKELGLRPNSSMFVSAIIAKSSLSNQIWHKKIKIMKSLGLSEEEVMIAFRKAPHIFMCSEVKIRKVMDFCVNTMKLEPTILLSYPLLLKYSFEERILPRFAVIEVLKLKKLVTSETFVWVFFLSEKIFMDKFMTKYLHEVQGLKKVYQQAKLGALGGRTEGELGRM